jgi:DNA-binding transcriptional LysR family regulator
MTKTLKQIHYKQNRLQQLRGFCHVVQTGSISKAAERMFLSQPSVSLQIQALERELNVILFERNGPHLKLTPEGKTLYELARPLVDGMDNLYESFMERYSDANSGSICIGASASLINYVIKEPVKQYMQEYPNVSLGVSDLTWEESVAAVRSDEVDLAVSSLPEQQECVIYEPLFSFDTVLILPVNHPLAEIDQPTLQQIAKFPLVLPPKHFMTDHIFKQHQLNYTVKVEVSSLNLVKRFVEAGIGISIVTKLCIEENEALVVKDLSTYFPSREYGLLLRKGRFISPQVKSFIHILKSNEIVKKLMRDLPTRVLSKEAVCIDEIAGVAG